MLNESSLIALSVGINNSEWPNQHFVTFLSKRVAYDKQKNSQTHTQKGQKQKQKQNVLP